MLKRLISFTLTFYCRRSNDFPFFSKREESSFESNAFFGPLVGNVFAHAPEGIESKLYWGGIREEQLLQKYFATDDDKPTPPPEFNALLIREHGGLNL